MTTTKIELVPDDTFALAVYARNSLALEPFDVAKISVDEFFDMRGSVPELRVTVRLASGEEASGTWVAHPDRARNLEDLRAVLAEIAGMLK